MKTDDGLMRLLVTGASGFIGCRLVQRLAERHTVFVVARPKTDVAIPQGRNIIPLFWNLQEPIPEQALPESVDGIVHLAQSRRYREFPGAAIDMMSVNVTAAIHLADYGQRVGARHFCLVSSGSVYEPYDAPLTETAALRPTSFNGASKLAAELLTEAYQPFMPVFIPRLFFPYGPGQIDKLIADLIDRVRRGAPLIIDAEGDGPWISPIYVDDVVDILATGIEQKWNGVVNVAGPAAISLYGLGTLIGRLLDRTPEFHQIDRTPLSMVPDLTKLKALYPLDNLIDIEMGLRRTIEIPTQLSLG